MVDGAGLESKEKSRRIRSSGENREFRKTREYKRESQFFLPLSSAIDSLPRQLKRRTDENLSAAVTSDLNIIRNTGNQRIKAQLPKGPNYTHLKNLMKTLNLHTVCEEARCPNIGECWGAGTLTFMILGDTCTRSCGFCHVKTGKGGELDWNEPGRVAEAVKDLTLNNAYLTHIVITSVNRDDKNYESARRRDYQGVRTETFREIGGPSRFRGDSNALGVI
jgi:tRNA A37 methylthiotransferase MiaB